MASHGDNKLEQIQEAGAAIIGAVAATASPKPLEMLQHVFSVAHDADTHRVQTNLVQQVWNGLVEPGQLSIRVNGGDAVRLLIEAQKVKNEQTSAMQRMLAMLDELADLTNRLRNLNEAIDERSETLLEKYGGVEGLKDAFLTEEEAEGLETLEDVYAAMVEKYLKPDGTLKPGSGAENLDPMILEQLRDFQEAQDVATKIGGISFTVSELGLPLSDQQQDVIDEAVSTSSIYQKASALQAAEGSELVKEAIIEANREEQVASSEAAPVEGFTIPGG